jgi:hypothetical protein
MKAILIRKVDPEDYWVTGLAVTIPDDTKTYTDALALPKVRDAINAFDWKSVTYADEIRSITIGLNRVMVVCVFDTVEREEFFSCDFITVID